MSTVDFTDDRGFNQVWADSPATRIRAQRRCDYLVNQMDINRNQAIMEIGCGIGTKAFWLAQKTGKKVLGTDLCVPFIEQARKSYQAEGLRYEVLDFNRAEQFKGETFDYIVGDGILHHLYHHLDEAFHNIKKLLNINGKIAFLEPNIQNPYVYLIFSYPWLRHKARLEPEEMAFSKRFIIQKLTTAGFKNIQVEYRDFLLPGIPTFMIKPSILLGAVLEKMPFFRNMAQSLFITAER